MHFKAETQKTLKYGAMGALEVYIDYKLFILPVEARGSVLALSASYRGRLLNPGVVTRGRAMSESLYISLTRQALLGHIDMLSNLIGKLADSHCFASYPMSMNR